MSEQEIYEEFIDWLGKTWWGLPDSEQGRNSRSAGNYEGIRDALYGRSQIRCSPEAVEQLIVNS